MAGPFTSSAWNIPALRRLETVIPTEEAFEAFEIEHDFKVIGQRSFILNVRKVSRPGSDVPFLLLTIDDVTEAREAQRQCEHNWRLAQNIVDTVRDPLVLLESDMTVVTASRAFLRLFNVTSEEVVGRRFGDFDAGQWDGPRFRTC